MHILYIAADYTGVHESLHRALLKDGTIQTTLYIPLNYALRERYKEDFTCGNSNCLFSSVASRWDKYFYKNRIKKVVKALLRKDLDWNKIDLIHATTCCIEGAIAYELYKLFDKPYIVAVRNTDLNAYFKYLLWEKRYFNEILLNASRVIFLSSQYKKRLLAKVLSEYRMEIELKSEIIYNGINEVFLEQNEVVKTISDSTVHIICTGAICPNKNQLGLINAISILRSKGYLCDLMIVGRGSKGDNSKYLRKVENTTSKYDWVTVLNKQSYQELISLYRKVHIFALCSFHETFGLVYAEALSQGLPLLYTKGEGFDGVYGEGKVGYNVDPNNSENIAFRLECLIKEYDTISKNIYSLRFEHFDWNKIAQKYRDLYNNILLNKN